MNSVTSEQEYSTHGYLFASILALVALVGAWVVLQRTGTGINLLYYLIISGVSVYIVWLDTQKQLVSMQAIAIGVVVGLLIGIGDGDLFARCVGAGIGTGFFGIQWLLTRGKGIGMGDVWFGAMMGLVLGEVLVLPAILIAYVTGFIGALVFWLAGAVQRNTTVPLAAVLSYVLVVVLIFQNEITEVVTQLFP